VTSTLHCSHLPNNNEPLALTVRTQDGAVMYRRLVFVQSNVMAGDGSLHSADSLFRHGTDAAESDNTQGYLNPDYFRPIVDDTAQQRVLFAQIGRAIQFNFTIKTERNDTLRLLRFGFLGKNHDDKNSFQQEIRADEYGCLPDYFYRGLYDVMYTYNRTAAWLNTLTVTIPSVRHSVRGTHVGLFWAMLIGSTDYSQVVEFITEVVLIDALGTDVPSRPPSRLLPLKDGRRRVMRPLRLHVQVESCSDVRYSTVNNLCKPLPAAVSDDVIIKIDDITTRDVDNHTENVTRYVRDTESVDHSTAGGVAPAQSTAMPLLTAGTDIPYLAGSSYSDSKNLSFIFRTGIPNCIYCRGEGWPLPRVQLYRADGSLMGSEESHSLYWYRDTVLSSVVAFLLRSPSDEYDGDYICVAENDAVISRHEENGGGRRKALEESVHFRISVV